MCFLTGLVSLSGPVRAEDVQEKAAQYVELLKKDAKDDAALAAKLLGAARAQAGNTRLGTALFEKAYDYGIREAAGYPTAKAAVEALIERVPAEMSGGKLALWVDGRLMAAGPGGAQVGGHGQGGAFGGHVDVSHAMGWPKAGFVGEIASFRISSAARYRKPFDPPHVLEKDAQTLLLLDTADLQPTAVSGNTIRDMAAPKGQWQLIGGAVLRATKPVD